MKRFLLSLVLIIAAFIALGLMFEVERRNLHRDGDRHLRVQQAAITGFPIVHKFLRAFPNASFSTPGTVFLGVAKIDRPYAFVVMDAKRRLFITCQLPAFTELDGRIDFEGNPVLERFEVVTEDHSISSRKISDLAESELDQFLDMREDLFRAPELIGPK